MKINVDQIEGNIYLYVSDSILEFEAELTQAQANALMKDLEAHLHDLWVEQYGLD